MIYARVRKDLREQGLTIPTKGGYLPEKYAEDLFECLQPEAWNDEEFNTILVHPTGDLFFAMSIDLEFE